MLWLSMVVAENKYNEMVNKQQQLRQKQEAAAKKGKR